MLVPVQLYIFINHIGTVFRIWMNLISPSKSNRWLFYLCSPPRRQWLIVHENDCITVHYEDRKLWGPVCSLDVTANFLGKWFPAPLQKMARTPMCLTSVYTMIGLQIHIWIPRIGISRKTRTFLFIEHYIAMANVSKRVHTRVYNVTDYLSYAYRPI